MWTMMNRYWRGAPDPGSSTRRALRMFLFECVCVLHTRSCPLRPRRLRFLITPPTHTHPEGLSKVSIYACFCQDYW